MCRWFVVLIVLVAGTLAGCVSAGKKRSTARSQGPSMAGLIGDDVVYVDVAVIERTFGDVFLNRDLWSEADEEVVHDEDDLVVSLERKAALEKNGFRIGQVGGLLPSKLQSMLTSQRDCQARRIQLHADHATPLPCGSPWPSCRFRLVRNDRSETVELEKAQCQLEMTPSLTDEGRIRLRFTPHVLHGEVKADWVPIRDADGVHRWDHQQNQAEESYPSLSWSLTVVPNEFVVLGALLDNGDTLGEQFFLTREEDHPIVQRLLVLRATHVSTPAHEDLGRCPPLALRVGQITPRGSSE